MISLSSSVEKKVLHQRVGSLFLFAGGEILFMLRVLNPVWILVSAAEGKGPLCCNRCVGNVVARILVWFYFIMWLGLYCPILCD
jgi:hypothetical protein